MNLLSAFQDDNGKVGSIRTAFLVSLFVVLLNWSYVNYQKQELQALPESVVVMVLGLGGVKAYQGYTESSERKLMLQKPKVTLDKLKNPDTLQAE